jgi:hypothetical protein
MKCSGVLMYLSKVTELNKNGEGRGSWIESQTRKG